MSVRPSLSSPVRYTWAASKDLFLSFFLLINNIIREENLPPPSSPQINNNNNNYNSRNRSATLTYMKNEDGLETRQWRPERPERPEARLLNLKYQARQVISFFFYMRSISISQRFRLFLAYLRTQWLGNVTIWMSRDRDPKVYTTRPKDKTYRTCHYY